MWECRDPVPHPSPAAAPSIPGLCQSPGTQHPQTLGMAQICLQTLQLGLIPSQEHHNKHKQMQRKQLKQSSNRRGIFDTKFDLEWILISSVDSVLGRRIAQEASAITAWAGPLCTGSEGQNGPSDPPAWPGEHRLAAQDLVFLACISRSH